MSKITYKISRYIKTLLSPNDTEVLGIVALKESSFDELYFIGLDIPYGSFFNIPPREMVWNRITNIRKQLGGCKEIFANVESEHPTNFVFDLPITIETKNFTIDFCLETLSKHTNIDLTNNSFVYYTACPEKRENEQSFFVEPQQTI